MAISLLRRPSKIACVLSFTWSLEKMLAVWFFTVFRLMTSLANKEITAMLGIRQKPVNNYIAYIFSKLQANDRTQAILYWLVRRLIALPPEESP